VDKVFNSLLRPPATIMDPALAGSLVRAAAAFARLDQALGSHPLHAAFLHRARLDAVRRQAAVDGLAIDPWNLAAVLEGLRLRMDGALRIIDRAAVHDAARHALDLHQWLTTPDPDKERDVQQAEKCLAAQTAGTPLLAAAYGIRQWIDGDGHGGTRPPIRAALIRFWTKHRLLHMPVPLTGARALQADTPWDEAVWIPFFLAALADEADEALNLLFALERVWFGARAAVAGRRRTSRAAAAVDILATAPLVSATSLAAGLGMAVKNATALLDAFCTAGIAVEVTHRSKRRLFGLSGLAPMRDAVRPPYRPDPSRSRGRPRLDQPHDPANRLVPTLPSAPLTPIDRRRFDYSHLDHWMAQMDQTIQNARRTLDSVASPARDDTGLSNVSSGGRPPPRAPDSPADRDH
jgi:hypothetical protein